MDVTKLTTQEISKLLTIVSNDDIRTELKGEINRRKKTEKLMNFEPLFKKDQYLYFKHNDGIEEYVHLLKDTDDINITKADRVMIKTESSSVFYNNYSSITKYIEYNTNIRLNSEWKIINQETFYNVINSKITLTSLTNNLTLQDKQSNKKEQKQLDNNEKQKLNHFNNDFDIDDILNSIDKYSKLFNDIIR